LQNNLDFIPYLDEEVLKNIPPVEFKKLLSSEDPDVYKERVRDEFIAEGAVMYILKNEFKDWIKELLDSYNKQLDQTHYSDLRYSINDVISEERRIKSKENYQATELIRDELDKLTRTELEIDEEEMYIDDVEEDVKEVEEEKVIEGWQKSKKKTYNVYDRYLRDVYDNWEQ